MSVYKLNSCLASQIENFISLRRLSGTDYSSQARLLGYFDHFLVKENYSEPRIIRQITDTYQQSLSGLSPRTRGNRFSLVRQLCEYLARNDPLSYIPETLPIPFSHRAHQPYIYSLSQVQNLLAAASELSTPDKLRPHTYRTLLGLLYSSGLRIGEALNVNLEHFLVAEQMLFIDQGKFRKDRWIVLSSSTCRALQQYRDRRLQKRPRTLDSPLLLNERHRRLTYPTVNHTFRHLLRQCGIAGNNRTGPRIHDLRHTFAVHRLLAWYQDGEDVNARLAAIRSLFAFIAREEPVLVVQCQSIRTIPLKRTEHKTIDYLEESEMQALLDAVDINSRTGIRDRALLMVLYNTGARVSEIVDLERADLRLNDSAQVTLHGKGNKERTCPIWPETVQAIEAYLKERAPNEQSIQQVFLNANGDPITRFGIRHVTRKYGDQAKIQQSSLSKKPVNPHCIRHTTAMHLLRAGNDMNMISYWLGHADLNTTHIYIEIDMEMKRNMLKKADAPRITEIAPWQKPNILKWLNELTKKMDLCAVNCGGNNSIGGKRRGMNNHST